MLYNSIFITAHCLTFGVRAFASWGVTNPGMVAIELVIPKRMPANLGAMSMWLMMTPDMANPVKPTARVRKKMALNLSLPRYPVKISPPAPPQSAVRKLQITNVVGVVIRNTFFKS